MPEGEAARMSNLPAPIDPNLLPAYREGLRSPYSQDIFLISVDLLASASPEFLSATPADYRLELRLREEHIEAVTEGGTPLGRLDPKRCEVLVRLMEAGKHLVGKFAPPQQVSVWLLDT